MTRLFSYFAGMVILLTTACAPLSPHESGWGDAGEIAGRALLCPVTLCTSELIFAMEYESRQRQAAHEQWYWSLSPEEQARQDQREAAAMQALGLGLMGSGPFTTPMQHRAVVPAPAANCTTYRTGDYLYTDCR